MNRWAIILIASGCNATAAVEDAGVVELDTGEMPIVLDAGVEAPDCGDTSSDPANCGACGRTCIIPHATAGCAANDCVITSCEEGWFDNDGEPTTGCEHLDTCMPAAPCPTACGTEGLTRCEQGNAICESPAELCNLTDENCDGQCDEGSLAGCRAPVHRAFGNGHLYTTDLAMASTAPFNLEAQNYFFVYTQPVPESRPLFLCRKSDGKRFLTSSTDCEVTGGPEATLGYWTPEASCGAVPLYRLFHAPSNNHFYTLSEGERDNAVTAYGYVAEGIAGWVWPAP